DAAEVVVGGVDQRVPAVPADRRPAEDAGHHPLLPFNGGTVEVEAALYKVSVAGPLAAAVELAGSLSTLLGPPLSAAATIADKISDGLDAVLTASGDRPVLAGHWSMQTAGGGGRPRRPVLGTTPLSTSV